MTAHHGSRRGPRSGHRKASRAFWALLVVTVLAAGALSSALTSPPGPGTGVRVAVSGVALLVAAFLAARVMIAIERARRTAAHTHRSSGRNDG